MIYFINTLIVLSVFFMMEGVAWIAHKYLMHGLLWFLHKDHHEPRYGKDYERNDSFFIIFATPAIVCFYTGFPDFSSSFWIATGITLYGIAYFFIHDVFIHQRLKFLRNANGLYFKAIRKAHKVHHKHLTKDDGECFGMLWAPLKYFIEAKKNVK
ncbi:MAG: beta-carotene hydroxylase [Bacteroidota bacterium]